MTAPLKPWERAGVNSRAFGGDIGTSMSNNVSAPGVSGSGGSSLGPTFPTTGSAGPPLPPRAPGMALDNSSSGFGSYRTGASSYSSPYSSTGYGSTGYGSTGYGSYGSYSGFGSYGGYGSGYGGYGSGFGGYNSYGSYGGLGSYGRPYGSTDNRFIAAAEESSQPAFHSLESIVQAFGSISMMLDSTLNAVYSSFRAVLGMADQFSRLRSHLGKVFSALAIFRTAKWAYMRLLYLLGLSRQNPNDAAWSKAIASAGSTAVELLTEADIKKPRSSWPITLFMAIIISAPYFIWRIISSLDKPSAGISDKSWADGLTEHYNAQADYDFNAANPQELSFKAGQTLRLAPRSLQPRITGWLLAAVDKQRIGLVPSNYIRILSKNDGPGPQQ